MPAAKWLYVIKRSIPWCMKTMYCQYTNTCIVRIIKTKQKIFCNKISDLWWVVFQTSSYEAWRCHAWKQFRITGPREGIHQSQLGSNAVEQTVEWKVIGNAMTVMWRNSSATFKLLIVLVSNSFVFMEKYSLLGNLNIRTCFTGSRTLYNAHDIYDNHGINTLFQNEHLKKIKLPFLTVNKI